MPRRPELGGLILAGGNATRMGGGDKPLLELGRRPMLAHIVARLQPQVGRTAISANGDPARFAAYGLPVLADRVMADGPLGGVQAGLAWAAALGLAGIVTVAGDTPFIPADLANRLAEAPGASASVVVAVSRGQAHPTVALWPLDVAGRLDAFLSSQQGRGIRFFLETVAHVFVDFDATGIDPFFNVNTPADLAEAQHLIAAGTVP